MHYWGDYEPMLVVCLGRHELKRIFNGEYKEVKEASAYSAMC